jgi:non-homologous end joining protein Ku
MRLIWNLSDSFETEKLADPEPEEEGDVIDLMAAPRESVECTSSARTGRSRAKKAS